MESGYEHQERKAGREPGALARDHGRVPFAQMLGLVERPYQEGAGRSLASVVRHVIEQTHGLCRGGKK